MNQDPRNSTRSDLSTFRNQYVLNDPARDLEAERLALTYLDRRAPDLIGVIMGHVL